MKQLTPFSISTYLDRLAMDRPRLDWFSFIFSTTQRVWLSSQQRIKASRDVINMQNKGYLKGGCRGKNKPTARSVAFCQTPSSDAADQPIGGIQSDDVTF